MPLTFQSGRRILGEGLWESCHLSQVWSVNENWPNGEWERICRMSLPRCVGEQPSVLDGVEPRKVEDQN